MPPTAAVLATDNLFPLVANDPNAYSLLWQADPVLALPFNGTHLPTYVLLAENRTYAMPPWLVPRLYDPSSYGVRGVAWSTIAGTLLLFEEGYRAAPTYFGRPPALDTLSPRQLVDADAGILVPTPGTSFGEVALNPLGALGTIWFGPQISLAPGNYSVTVTLRADPAPGFSPPGPRDPVIWIGAGAFGLPEFYGYANPFGSVSGPGWSTVAFHFQVPAPVIQFSVQGVALDPSAEISLEQVELVPTA